MYSCVNFYLFSKMMEVQTILNKQQRIRYKLQHKIKNLMFPRLQNHNNIQRPFLYIIIYIYIIMLSILQVE